MKATTLSADPAARRDELLSNQKVRTWHQGRALSSQLSADNDLRKIGLLLTRLRLNPESVVAVASKDPERLQAALIDYATSLKRSGRGDAYIVKTLNGLKNYLAFRRVEFEGYPKLSANRTTTLENERIPSPEELGRVLDRLPLRSKVVTLFLAHSGLRPGVLGSYRGERGLTLGDLAELDLQPEPHFQEVPFAIRVPADLSKTKVAYTTFGTRQLAETFLAYLAERRDRGENLSTSSAVVARTPTDRLRGVSKRSSSRRSGRFMWTHAMTDGLAEILHSSQPEGVTWRVYVLRSYCSTRLMLGPMNRDLREAILGHSTGVSGRYNVGKKWPPELLAEARREYAASAYLLETVASTTIGTKAELVATLVSAVEQATGKKTDGTLRGEDLVRALRDALGAGTASGRTEGGEMSAGQLPPKKTGEQRVVSESAVAKLLEAGWRFVSPLNSHLAIVQWDGSNPS